MKFFGALPFALTAYAFSGSGDAGATHVDTDAARHQEVYDTIMQSYNGRPANKLVDIADMLEEDAEFCFPYPYCVTGRSEAKAFFQKVYDETSDAYMISSQPDGHLVYNLTAGWARMDGTSYKLKGSDASGCQVVTSEYWTWDLSSSTDGTMLKYIMVYFDEKEREIQSAACGSNSLVLGENTYSEPVRKAIEGTLVNHFHYFQDKLALPTANPNMLDGWYNPWSTAQEDGTSDRNALEAPPGDFFTRSDVRNLIKNEIATVDLAFGNVRIVSPIYLAGTVASAVTVYTDVVESTGCMSSHFQFMRIELDPAKVAEFNDATEAPYPSEGCLLNMKVWYSYADFTPQRHKCDGSN